MSILLWCLIKVVIFFHLLILTSSNQIKNNVTRKNKTGYCPNILYEQEGFDKDWTIMADDSGRWHRVNLIQDDMIEDQNNFTADNFVKFYLFTKSNVKDPEEIFIKKKPKYFMAGKPLIILAHGWNGDSKSMADIRDAYLRCCDYNIVVIDWSKHAKTMWYNRACKWVTETGTQVGRMASYLKDMFKFSASIIDLVGHSLGAHVMGAAGREFLRHGNNKIGRIFGLDPARPFFELLTRYAGLTKNDAGFVQVVHSNAGFAGVLGPYGHIDFYPNGGGVIMPGCENATSTETAIDCAEDIVCSHRRAVLYFAESLVTGGFTSTYCTDYVSYKNRKCNHNDQQPIGEECSKSAKGNYFLDTEAEPPFSKG